MRKTAVVLILCVILVATAFAGCIDWGEKKEEKAENKPPINQVSGTTQPPEEGVTVQFIDSTYEIASGGTSGWFHTGQDADIMVSGIDFNNTGGPLLFNHQGNVASDGTHLLLADRNNNRVLIWNSTPTENSPPDIVLGQENFYANNPGTGLNHMCWPVSVATDGQHVVVADTYNDRVLIWNNFSTLQNGTPADLELKEGIGWPWAVWTNGTKLVVASTACRAVLIWNTFPTSDVSADIFISLLDFGTPRAIASDGNHLVIGDHNAFVNGTQQQGNFFWKTFPNQTNQPYDFFVAEISMMGQPSQPQTIGAILWGTMTSDGKLIGVSNQLYIWNSFPVDRNDTPDLSVGAPYFGAPGYDFGGSQSGDGSGVAVAEGRLYISLSNGNKIVVYNSFPTGSSQNPDFAIGSPDIYTNTLRSNYFITNPGPVSDGESLFVSSDFDCKLYVWKYLPDESGAKPDIVYNLSFAPWDSALFENTYVLAGRDTVCIWNTLPKAGELPDLWFKGGIGNVTFQDLRGVALDNKYFYLADKTANKIYVWEGIPNNNTTNAKFSIDTSMPARLSSDGTYLVVAATEAAFGERIKFYKIDGLSSSTQPILLTGINVNLPEAALAAGGHLFIADTVFNRVLVWNNISDAVNGIHPEIVLGEEDFNDTHPEIGIDKLFWPARLTFDGSYLWVGEYKFSGRVVRFSPTSLVTVSGDGFEITYENVTYVSAWPPERWIKRWVAVKNTVNETLFLNFDVYCIETGVNLSPFPQPSDLCLEPGESENILYQLDIGWRTNISDESPPGNYTFTTRVRVFPCGNESNNVTVYLDHLVRFRLEDFTPTNAVVYGHVYDENCEPVPSGIMQVGLNGADAKPQYATVVGEGGYYSISCWAGRYQMSSEIHKYILSVAAPGYKTFNKVLEPQEGDNIEVNIYLEKTTDNASYTLTSSYDTNLTIWRGDVTADEQYLVISHAHIAGFTEEEMHERASIYYFSMNGTLLWSRFIGNEVWGIDVSDDGSYVAANILLEGKIILLDNNGTELWNNTGFEYPYFMSREVRISHNNQYVAIGATAGGLIFLLNLTDGSLVQEIRLGAGQIRRIEFSADDQYIYVGNGDGFLYKLDINGDINETEIWRANIEAWPYTDGLAITPDESYIATASKLGRISFINGSNGNVLWSFDTCGGGHWVNIAPDVSFVVAGSGGAYATSVFDQVGNLQWWCGNGDSGKITSDGKYILMSGQSIELCDTNNTVLWSYPASPTQTDFSYITKDCSKIVAGTREGKLYFFEGGLTSNTPSVAHIDSISPNPAAQGETVTFIGHGDDPDGSIAAYNWRSSIDGQLSTSASFSLSTLSVGAHTIYFKVQDNNGTWSSEVSEILTINPAGGDTSPPEITGVQAVPETQEVYGYMNIMCTVTDNVGVNVVKVNITYPNGTTKNITMMKVGTNSYSYNTSYSVLGNYSYYIWADDISGNQNKSGTYTFSIRDSTKPSITNPQATPPSQTAGGYVNITCTVTDNIGISKVKVSITGPSGFAPVNTTMTKIAGTNNYYYNSPYTITGTYSYYIWANDTSNNQLISAVSTFEIYTANLAPAAVVLNSPTDITATTMLLSWSQNTDSDFANYTIYQSTASGVLGNAIKVITTNTTTSWTVTGLSPSTTYYFTVRVYDTGNLYNDSNQVSGTTLTGVTSGNLTGIVTDKNGKPIEGATVSIVDTGYVTWTDSNGRYTFTGVTASSYDVKAEKSGYKTKTETGVVVNAGVTTTLNIVLEEEKKAEPKGFIPGFETFLLLIVLAGCAVLLKHRKRFQ